MMIILIVLVIVLITDKWSRARRPPFTDYVGTRPAGQPGSFYKYGFFINNEHSN